MIRLTNEQWERIRNHFRKSTSPMDVLDASRSRPDVFSKLYCGYSTPARSGTCCRKAIRTTNPYIGAFDRAYDSDPLDEELRRDGIEMIAPHRSNRSMPPTQDRRRLSRYMRRWLVERFFAWIQWQRRILVRWEY